jgi:hypothetical protein
VNTFKSNDASLQELEIDLVRNIKQLMNYGNNVHGAVSLVNWGCSAACPCGFKAEVEHELVANLERRAVREAKD